VVTLIASGTVCGIAQQQPAETNTQQPAGTNAQQPAAAQAAKKAPETKPATPPDGKTVGNYRVHQMVELGGRIAERSGSIPMWATMVNQTTGFRVLAQSLDMHSMNTSKTPFFDVLTTNSYGYGGDPYNGSYLNASKGRWWDFAGSFRRDRNYFDYNLIVQPNLTTATVINPPLVLTPSTLHIFNTVRYNTSTLLTLFPVSRVHARIGYNHGTHEGPTYSTIHNGGDVQLSQWFRNSLDTYVGGIDVNVAKRTTLSYDQFLGFYRGDTSWHLAPTPFVLRTTTTPVSLGVTVLTGPTNTGGQACAGNMAVVNGVANEFCSGTIQQSWTAPSRTSFPTEQFRFVSHYWDRVGMNGRFAYSGGVNNINHFNETFNGLVSRSFTRQEIFTGALANGRLAHNKRINVNADYNVGVELTKFLSITDTFNFWNFRIPGSNAVSAQVWAGTSSTNPPNLNMLTPLSQVPVTTTTTTNTGYLAQKNTGNTILAVASVTSHFKLSGGWRFNDRQIKFGTDPTLVWHQNWALVGAVIQPSQIVRLNVDYEGMSSSSANSATPTNTYTREAPNNIQHIVVRTLVNPRKWVSLAGAYNGYYAKNDDPLVNHKAHNNNVSFAAHLIPAETLSLDFNYAYEEAYSRTDLCYQFTANPQAPLPPGAVNAGTCTAANGGGSGFYLGNGYYNSPVNFFLGGANWAPKKYLNLYGAARVTHTNGSAEMLNPLMQTGALGSTVVDPYVDVQVKIAPEWWWHGNWEHHGYNEFGGIGPAPREFHGDIYTLGVKYAF